MDAHNFDKISGKGTFWPNDEEKPPISLQVVDNRQRKYDVEWLFLYQGIETGVTLVEQAEYEKPLTQTEYRVRDMILGSIGVGAWAIINQSEIARRIRVDRAKVCHAIKRLIELGIVELGKEKMGRNSQYRIAPGFGFKGSMPLGQKKVKEAAKQHKEKVIQFSEQARLPLRMPEDPNQLKLI